MRKETQEIKRLSDPNYEGGNYALPENASELEKSKYEICQNIARYKRINELSLKDLAYDICLETKIANLQAPKSLTDLPISQEVKAEVIKISQELGLTAQSCAKLESATSYQELSDLQKEAYQEKLNSEVASRKSANYLNWGLGVLSIGSLLILAYLLIKKTTFTPEIGKDKKDK